MVCRSLKLYKQKRLNPFIGWSTEAIIREGILYKGRESIHRVEYRSKYKGRQWLKVFCVWSIASCPVTHVTLSVARLVKVDIIFIC